MSKNVKNYEVSVTAFARVLVIAAESPEEALDFATEELRFGDLEMDEASIRREVTEEELERSRQCTDKVVYCDEYN